MGASRKTIDGLEKSKVTVKRFERLEKRLDAFASIEHIDQLKNFFLPKIEAFAKKIDKFEESNQSVRECIVRFD